MHRRGHGIGAIKNKNLAQARYKDKGTELAEDQFAQMAKQMETFRGHLEDFAAKHKDDIKKDPQFRVQFQEMCASIGVDPLASSKGFWAEMLGVGDFYYELGVQIIEVCLATSHRNGDFNVNHGVSFSVSPEVAPQKKKMEEEGDKNLDLMSRHVNILNLLRGRGLIGLEELRDRLVSSRGKRSQDISLDDVFCAIKKLKVLGNGFTVIPVGRTYLVQSVPGELSMDHTAVLQLAQENGYVSKSELTTKLKWEEERTTRTLNFMVKEGLAWIDDQAVSERHFWFPSFFPYNDTSTST